MDRAIAAAHDVEVGDYNFDDKNYRGALSRFQLAAENKPNDAAIEVRLGRASERLHDNEAAVRYYQAATSLNGPEKWVNEARSALQRLQNSSASQHP